MEVNKNNKIKNYFYKKDYAVFLDETTNVTGRHIFNVFVKFYVQKKHPLYY